jgi:hypothetical protein
MDFTGGRERVRLDVGLIDENSFGALNQTAVGRGITPRSIVAVSW